MAFTEQATLKILDASTKPLNAINAAMEKVLGTSNKLNGKRATLTFTATGIDAVLGKVRQVEAATRRPMQMNFGNMSGAASQLNALTAAYNRAAAAAQRLASVRPPTVPPIPPVPPGGGSRGGRQPVDPGYFGRFPENVPGIMARYAGWKVAQYTHDAARSAGQGILAGNDQRTIDKLQRLTEGQKQILPDGTVVDRGRFGAENWEMARTTSGRYQTMSSADAVELIRQARPQVDESKADKLGAIPEAAAKLQTIATAVYGDAKKGQDTAYKIMRAGIAAGRIDDPEKFAAFTEEIGRAMIQSGKDLSSTLMESMFRNAGALAKYGVGGKMIGDMVNLSDEERGRAADRIRSFTESLTRPDKKKDMKDLMEAEGLRVKGGGAVDVGLLARDGFEWVQKNLAPKIEADLKQKGMSLPSVDDTEEDRAKKVGEIRTLLASKYGFTGPESQYPLMAIIKAKETRQERAERGQYDTSSESLRKLQYGHFRTGLAAIGKQWQNFADAFVENHESKIAPILGAGGGLLNYASKNPATAAGMMAGMAGGGIFAASHIANAMMQHPGLTAAGLLHMRAAAALMAAARALGAGGMIGAGTRAAAGGAMGKASTLFGPAAVAASRSPGIVGGMRGAWNNMGWLGKGLTGLGALSGGAALLGGDYLGGAGALAMTAGGLMSGPLGWTLLLGGALATFWPVLKSVLGSTEANAAEATKKAQSASAALEAGLGEMTEGDAGNLSHIERMNPRYTGESKAEHQQRIGALMRAYMEEMERQRRAQYGDESETDADGLPTAKALAAKAAREGRRQAAHNADDLSGTYDLPYTMPESNELPNATGAQDGAQRLIDMKKRMQNAQEWMSFMGNQFGDEPPPQESSSWLKPWTWGGKKTPPIENNDPGGTYNADGTQGGSMPQFVPPQWASVFTEGGDSIRNAGSEAGTSIASGGAEAGNAIQTGGAGVAAQLQAAITSGGAALAAQISGALSQGVNVNVNQSGGSKPPNVGNQSGPAMN